MILLIKTSLDKANSIFELSQNKLLALDSFKPGYTKEEHELSKKIMQTINDENLLYKSISYKYALVNKGYDIDFDLKKDNHYLQSNSGLGTINTINQNLEKYYKLLSNK